MENLITIIGSVALLLWGLRMVRNGVMSAYGPAIKAAARDSQGKKIVPFLSGLFAAVALQSSTATAMIAGSFAAKKTISTATAFIIIIGADLGTAVAAIIASQKITALAPALLAIGIFGFLNSDKTKPKGVFRAIAGVGVILLALSLVSEAALELATSEDATSVVASLLAFPILAICVGVVLTYLAHSSLAIVLLAVAGLLGGLIGPAAAVYLVIGANIGSGLLLLMAHLNARFEARQAVTANLIVRCIGAAVILYGWEFLAAGWLLDSLALPLQLHLGLNIIVAVFGLLATQAILKIAAVIISADVDDDRRIDVRFLDDGEINQPTKALALAKREALAMAEVAQLMVERSRVVLESPTGNPDDEIVKLEDGLDRLFDAIKLYVARVLQQPLNEAQTRQAMDTLSFTANLEHVGDVVEGNLTSLAARKHALHAEFSKEGRIEIAQLFETVLHTFGLAVNTFLTEDRDLARQLYKSKTEMRDLQQRFIASHMDRLGSGTKGTIQTSSVHIDLIRDLKRINSYLAAVAYPVLKASGEVPKTKWKKT